jgi:uncharacterized protein YoaH (UPF0181 family)
MMTAEKLRERLAEAAARFDERGDDDEKTDFNRRQAVLDALAAVLDHLRDLEFDGPVRRPLISLAEALVALDTGSIHPLLKPHHVGGQSGSPLDLGARMHRATAIAIVDGLIAQGLSKQDAIAQVARRLRIGWGELETWREDKHRALFKGFPKVEDTYRKLIKYIKAQGPEPAFRLLDERLGPEGMAWATRRRQKNRVTKKP